MKLKPEQLIQHLRTTLLPVYWVNSDEILLLQEMSDMIRQKALAAGYTRELIQADTQYDGSTLNDATRHFSLFSELQFIEVRLSSHKINEAFKKQLQNYFSTPPDHCILLVTSPKLPMPTWQSAWFRELDKIGAVVTAWPIDAAHFPGWIQQRLKQKGLITDFSASKYLAEAFEGNLLAAVQAIEQLALITEPNQTLDKNEIEKIISSDAQFDVFQLIDTVLLGNFSKAYRILKNLETEGVEPTLILWAMTRELHLLAEIIERKNAGQYLDTIFTQLNIRNTRKRVIQAALSRLELSDIHYQLHSAARIDLRIKGIHRESVWEAFATLTGQLSGHLNRNHLGLA